MGYKLTTNIRKEFKESVNISKKEFIWTDDLKDKYILWLEGLIELNHKIEKKKSTVPFLCKIGIHRKRTVFVTGKYIYLECKKCGYRFVKELYYHGYQPIDKEWLENK